MLGSPQLPNFFVKSDIFIRVRVRVSSTATEVLAGGLVLPLGCNANVVFTGIANAAGRGRSRQIAAGRGSGR